VVDYAAEKVRSGSWAPEGAVERSRRDFAKFLPAGLASGGHGTEVMALAEAEARRHGLREMQLHVFGFNTPAIALYTKLGYSVVDMLMRKSL
jgi:GNAT superfamily N-acetyltransferase